MVRTKKRHGGTIEEENTFFEGLDVKTRTKLQKMWNDPHSNRGRIMEDFGNPSIKRIILERPRFPWGITQSDTARAPDFFPLRYDEGAITNLMQKLQVVHDEDTITKLMKNLPVVGKSDTPSGADQSSGGTRRRRIHRRTHHRRRRTHRRRT
jgi:hypothetical protein